MARSRSVLRAAAYVCVRPEQEHEPGPSLDHQRVMCEALAARHDLAIVNTIIDHAEDPRPLRGPGMARALRLVRTRQIDALVVAALDRVAVSVRDLSEVIAVCGRHGVSLLSAAEALCTSSPRGAAVLKLVPVKEDRRRTAIAQRTKDALAAKRRNGQVYGRIPYGLQLAADGVTLQPCPAEQQMIETAMAWRRSGETWKAITFALNEAGYRNRAGRPWILTNLRSAVITAERHRFGAASRAGRAGEDSQAVVHARRQ